MDAFKSAILMETILFLREDSFFGTGKDAIYGVSPKHLERKIDERFLTCMN